MSEPGPTVPSARATSARTLTQAAAGCLLLGLVIGSPAGAMALYVLASVFALPAAALAQGQARLWAGIALLAAWGLAYYTYPDFTAHMAAYSRHAGGG